MENFEKIKTLISGLTGLLVQENEHIKQGDYRTLKASHAAKTVKLGALEKALFEIKSERAKAVLLPHMEAMQKQVSINAVLLSSALNGVKSANARLVSIRDRDRQTGTYNRRGQSVNMSEVQALKIKVL